MTIYKIIFLLLAINVAFVGCSSRVVYGTTSVPIVSSDAININTATVEELEKLPHIGRKTAESIIRFRTDNGLFRRPEYLMQIRGISEKRFLELRPLLKTE